MKLSGYIFLIVFIFTANSLFGQVNQFVGPTGVTAGQTAAYSYTKTTAFGTPTVSVSNGSVGSAYISSDPNTVLMTVTWGTSGSGSLTLYSGPDLVGVLSVTISACPAMVAPTSSSASPSTVCHNSASTLLASPTGTGNSIIWYSAATGGTVIGYGASLPVVVVNTTSYYPASYNTVTGCIGTRASAVTVTTSANTAPSIPAGYYTPITIYGHGSAAISVTPPSSPVYNKWYASSGVGGTPLATNVSSFTTTDLTATTSFFVSAYNSSTSCESDRKECIVTVSPTFGAMKVTSETIRVSGVTSEAGIPTLTDLQKSTSNLYLDGLGRAVQSVALRATPITSTIPVATDIIQAADFDSYGRPHRSYLPYVKPGSTDGSYQLSFQPDQLAFYSTSTDKVANDSKPYSSVSYEKNPIGRPVEQGNIGQSFQVGSTHTQRITYSYNTGNSGAIEEVRKFNPDATSSSFYLANQVAMNTFLDPNGNKSISYVDNEGRTIAIKKQINGATYSETYYVYNDLNQLSYILPPAAVTYMKGNGWSAVQSVMDQYAFQFRYDKWGRVVQKKTPGQSWIWFVYDKLNRLVLSQDGNLRPLNKWSFVKYDGQGRAIMSGLYKNTTLTKLSSMQGMVNGLYVSASTPYFEQRSNTTTGFTNASFPTANADASALEIFSINFYDDYDFNIDGADEFNYLSQGLSGEGTQGPSIGLLTATKTLIVGTSSWLSNYIFYDKYGRVIQTQSNNHLSLGSVNNFTTQVYDFEKVLQVYTDHNVGANRVRTLVKYTYDTQGRLLQIRHNIDHPTDPAYDKLIVQNEYNELGQLVDKKLHYTGTDFLQSVDYRYSIQGRITSINNASLTNDGSTNDETTDFFGINLLYEGSDATLANAVQYDGKVSATKWKGPFGGSTATDQRSYKYSYDNNNQLTTAGFQKFDGAAWSKEADVHNEAATYDISGNILTMKRNQNLRSLNVTYSGGTPTSIAVASSAQSTDDMAYTYATPNALTKVEDAVATTVGTGDFKNGASVTTEYTYDSLGNITADQNKGITSITYNVFGKTSVVTMTGGKSISYIYDGKGRKLTTSTTSGGSTVATDYVDAFVYTAGQLDYFASPEGRVMKKSSAYEYQYAIADHQGNTRVLFTSADPVVQTLTAAFEGSDSNVSFDKYPTGMNISSSYDHTTGTGHSLYLNGGANGMIGLAKSYQVVPGDKVSISAYARYIDATGDGGSYTSFAAALITAFSLPLPGPTEVGTPSAGLNSWGTLEGQGFGNTSSDSSHPKAFITILMFDTNFQLVGFSYDQVKTTSFGYLSAEFTATEPGYAFVYVSNENPTMKDVYFDDITLSYTPTRVLQYSEYYPFGSQNQNSWTRPNASNRFLYNQGGELNTTSGLYDLDLRNYDPLLGRFFQVDPMAASFHNKSVYLYAGNNPTNVNDPSGGSESADPTGMWGNQSRLAEWANSISYGYGTATDGSSLGHGNGGGGLHSKYFGMSDKNVLKAAKGGDPEALGEYLDRLAASGYVAMYQISSTQSATFLNNLLGGKSLDSSLKNANAFSVQVDPSREKGGFIDGDKFYGYMKTRAKTWSIEVAAIVLKDGDNYKYFILPWKDNVVNHSYTYSENLSEVLPGYTIDDVSSWVHTHNIYGEDPTPSPGDKRFSASVNRPVYVISPDLDYVYDKQNGTRIYDGF